MSLGNQAEKLETGKSGDDPLGGIGRRLTLEGDGLEWLGCAWRGSRAVEGKLEMEDTLTRSFYACH